MNLRVYMKHKINLVIPAAGEATRLRPLSSYTSKAMVRVNGKPCIDYIIDEAKKNSIINEIVIVDGKFDDIREYCKIKHPNVKFAKQPQLNGPRDAIAIGMNTLTDPTLPVVVWLGDAIILEKDLPLGEDFLLCKIVDDHHNWCMWDGLDFYDKPSHKIVDGAALVGLYSFSNGVNALKAFTTENTYDISGALKLYGKNALRPIHTDQWYDIGDLPTYYNTCAELLNLKSRAFHTLKYDRKLGVIEKIPEENNQQSAKSIFNEKQWYLNLSPTQSMFTPKILPHKKNLILSYESGTLLSDLMLYENIRESTWEYIIDKLFDIKLSYFNTPMPSHNTENTWSQFQTNACQMWLLKLDERLNLVPEFTQEEKDKLMKMSIEVLSSCSEINGMHGDLHLGNIIYNQQTDQMKFIDPRGQYGSSIGLAGDNIYDFAKLAHDAYHGYNSMVSNVPHNPIVKNLFLKALLKNDLNVGSILNGGLILIASCIPLHYDCKERQQRFINYVKGELNEKYSF